MADEIPTTPDTESWLKSSQITRALGLPFVSLMGVYHLVKGWRSGEFGADDLAEAFQTLVWVGVVVYYPVHAAVVWIVKRVKAGKDPNSPAPEIVPPKIVTATGTMVRRLTGDLKP